MNRRGWHIPHPATVYLLLLLAVMLISWIGSVYAMRGIERNSDIVLRSLLDAQGMRWLVSNSAVAISVAPVGNAILLLSAIGLVYKSGLWRVLCRLSAKEALSYKERVGLAMAMIVMVLFAGLVVTGLFFGDRVLLGITGTLLPSPLSDGIMLMLFLLTGLPSVVYGSATGIFRNTDSVIGALLWLAYYMSSLLITMLVASQLLAAFDYSGLDRIIGLGAYGRRVLEPLVWWLPLPWIIVRKAKLR